MIVRLVVAAPLLVLVLAFALSNRDPVTLGLWPTDYTVDLPVSLAMLGALGVGLIGGALAMGPDVLRQRRRARRAERRLRTVEAGQVAPPVLPPVLPPALAAPALDP